MSSEENLKKNSEIYESLSQTAKNLFDEHPVVKCTNCDTNDYVSKLVMLPINPDVIALLDSKYFIYQGCSFGTCEITNFKCRKCETKFK